MTMPVPVVAPCRCSGQLKVRPNGIEATTEAPAMHIQEALFDSEPSRRSGEMDGDREKRLLEGLRLSLGESLAHRPQEPPVVPGWTPHLPRPTAGYGWILDWGPVGAAFDDVWSMLLNDDE